MSSIRKYFDVGSLLVIFVTLLLFVTALFLKGFTHDLLLEAGIFLVSVKRSFAHELAVGSKGIVSSVSTLGGMIDQQASTNLTLTCCMSHFRWHAMQGGGN